VSGLHLAGGVRLGLLLWRTQLAMFVNQTLKSRKPGRLTAVAFGVLILVLLWAWEAFVTALALRASHRFSFQLDPAHLFSLAFFTYTGILVFSSLVFSLNALLLNPDLDLLLSSPRPGGSGPGRSHGGPVLTAAVAEPAVHPSGPGGVVGRNRQPYDPDRL